MGQPWLSPTFTFLHYTHKSHCPNTDRKAERTHSNPVCTGQPEYPGEKERVTTHHGLRTNGRGGETTNMVFATIEEVTSYHSPPNHEEGAGNTTSHSPHNHGREHTKLIMLLPTMREEQEAPHTVVYPRSIHPSPKLNIPQMI